MAKFIDEKNLINKHISSYMDRVTDFSKYIHGSPSFVTYYGKDLSKSTEDPGLNGVYETVGNESPIMYQKIENFPIFNFEEINPDVNYDEETGFSTNLEGTAIMLPGTIKPFTDDRFMISYLDRKDIMFRISNVEIGSIANKVYYKISFYRTTNKEDVMLDENISETYETLYDNVGKDEKILVRKDIYKILEELELNFGKLRSDYLSTFYHENINSILYGNEFEYRYDNYLITFIRNNNLFIKRNTFMYNLIIEPWIEGSGTNSIYKHTLYNAIETKSTKFLLNEINYVKSSITSLKAGSLPLLRSYPYRNCKVCDYVGTGLIDYNFSFCPGSPVNLFADSNLEKYKLFNDEFLNNIKNNIQYNDNLHFIENIIIMYMNNYDSKNLAIYINENSNNIIIDSYEKFLLLPIILYIINVVYEDVKTKY